MQLYRLQPLKCVEIETDKSTMSEVYKKSTWNISVLVFLVFYYLVAFAGYD